MTPLRSRLAWLLLPLALAGCDAEPAGSPERTAARREAARSACVAEELVIRARETATEMEQVAPGTGPYAFAAAYRDYAELRFAAAAYADSASRAETPADSARYAARAVDFTPGRPSRETLEANIAQAYARDGIEILANPVHPCNQPAPGAEARE